MWTNNIILYYYPFTLNIIYAVVAKQCNKLALSRGTSKNVKPQVEINHGPGKSPSPLHSLVIINPLTNSIYVFLRSISIQIYAVDICEAAPDI